MSVQHRPVTQLPVLSKVMEAIIAVALMVYLKMQGIRTPEQHGFRQCRSCTTDLLLVCGSRTETIDSGRGVDAIYLDFAKV